MGRLIAPDNTVVGSIWDELLTVPYVSPQPGIQMRFVQAKDQRADVGAPKLNNQPWYNGSEFRQLDASAEIVDGRYKP